MTETLPSNDMHHAFAHVEDAVSLPSPSPPSLTARQLPFPTADDYDSLHSPPQSQRAVPGTFELQGIHAGDSIIAASGEREPTPPSSSTFSSQEHAPTTATTSPSSDKTESQIAKVIIGNTEVELTTSAQGSPVHGETSHELLSGSKRTASGQLKRSSISSINDLKLELNRTRYSRTSSILSNGSTGSVMELSQQLRTRLNYAMVKVQNGWQSRSLDEVESLASQSPRSTVSGFQHATNGHSLTSQRTAMTANLHRKWSSSDSSDGGATSRPQTSDTNNSYSNGRNYQAGQIMAKRALAPPADIVPGSRRRPHSNGYFTGPGPNGTYAPGLQRNPSRPKPKPRTPSQNAAMEADAVETLMFMASPNNSGHHPPTFSPHESSLRSTQPAMSQTSPLRTHFSGSDVLLSPKRVAFAPQPLAAGKPFDKAAAIERMLDEFDDDSSDDLQEAVDITQRQHTTGPMR